MPLKQIAIRRTLAFLSIAGLAVTGALLAGNVSSILGQAKPAADAKPGVHLEVAPGTTASYRVTEQLAGVNFPSDAVGSTDVVTGNLVIAPDGSIDSAQSKLSFDLRTLKSDQDLRDGYIRNRVIDTGKFPFAEFVPKHIEGVPSPLPITGQAGFTLVGDMTIHGVTSEVTWMGIVTFAKDQVAGRATTNFAFSTFSLPKPTLARLLSVGDKIQLEIEFKMKKEE